MNICFCWLILERVCPPCDASFVFQLICMYFIYVCIPYIYNGLHHRGSSSVHFPPCWLITHRICSSITTQDTSQFLLAHTVHKTSKVLLLTLPQGSCLLKCSQFYSGKPSAQMLQICLSFTVADVITLNWQFDTFFYKNVWTFELVILSQIWL